MLVAPMFLMLLLPRLMKGMDPEAQKVRCIHSYILPVCKVVGLYTVFNDARGRKDSGCMIVAS